MASAPCRAGGRRRDQARTGTKPALDALGQAAKGTDKTRGRTRVEMMANGQERDQPRADRHGVEQARLGSLDRDPIDRRDAANAHDDGEAERANDALDAVLARALG